jgi:hypothetical protein
MGIGDSGRWRGRIKEIKLKLEAKEKILTVDKKTTKDTDKGFTKTVRNNKKNVRFSFFLQAGHIFSKIYNFFTTIN